MNPQDISHRGRSRQGKTGGAFGFALNFLWLLSFFKKKKVTMLLIVLFNLKNKKKPIKGHINEAS
jgi:hypothetical protein